MAYQKITANFSGKIRRATLHGREHIVAPLSLIVPGVLNGSKGALFYPLDEISKDPDRWNHVPITDGHPKVDGRHVSARDPDILNSHAIGVVLRTKVRGKLVAEGWFDVAKTNEVNPSILNALNKGKPFELSTGLFTDNVKARRGSSYNGKAYDYTARNYKPDHVAVLMNERGACSTKDGCGVLVNKQKRQQARRVSVWNKLGRMLGITDNGGPGSGPRPGDRRGGSFTPQDAKSKALLFKMLKAGAPTKFNPKKLTIDKAAQLLKEKGHELVKALPFDMKKMEAYYHVRTPDGSVKKMSSSQIKSIVSPSKKQKGGSFTPKDTNSQNLLFKMMSAGAPTKFKGGRTRNAEKGKSKRPFPAQAFQKSAAAKSATRTAQATGTPEAQAVAVASHKEAARFHGKAAAFMTKRNDSAMADKHTAKQDYHLKSAKRLRKAVHNQDGRSAGLSNNSNGDLSMKLSRGQRAKIIRVLTANCDCWKDEDDVETLNSFSDKKLMKLAKQYGETKEITLAANAAVTGLKDKAGNAYKFNGKTAEWEMTENESADVDDEVDDDADDDDDDEVVNERTKSKPAPKKPQTVEAWMKDSSIPVEVRNSFKFSQGIINQQKKAIVERLTANVEDEADRKRVSARLMSKDLDELQDMALLAPTTANEDEIGDPAPKFFGAAPAVNRKTMSEQEDEDDLLPLPVMNYAEVDEEEVEERESA